MFYFCVEYVDNDGDIRQDSGILTADSYQLATARLSKYYGEKCLVSLYIEEWDNLLTEDEVLEGFEAADDRMLV